MTEPADPSAPPARAAGEFRCPACGGAMQFDAAQNRMLCAYCGATRNVGGEADGAQSIVEYDLESGLAEAPRGYGAEVRTLACQACGAVVNHGERGTSRRCDFCGSPQVLEQLDRRKPIRPESVVPFQVDRSLASTKFRSWLGGLWFRPSDLKALANVTEMTGVYVPYWAFDAEVHSDWTAEAGHYHYVTETRTYRDEKGHTRTRQEQVRKVRWRPAWGSRDDIYDDLLVCGSKGLPVELSARLEPFDTSRLVPYDPGFLAGWLAEEYSVDLNAAWRLGVSRMEATQRARCSSDVPGDTQRHLHVVNRFASERFKHILLPIWISVYRYRGEPYRFLVNGQTGEVTGRAPWSVWKLTFAALLAALLAFIVWQVQR